MAVFCHSGIALEVFPRRSPHKGRGLALFRPAGKMEGRKIFLCALGQSGVRADKKEGDGATPAGDFALRAIFYRAGSRRPLAASAFARPAFAHFGRSCPVHPLAPAFIWNDNPADAFYNRLQRRSSQRGSQRSETLWRGDQLYDVIGVLGYNDFPPQAGRGSAIFLHQTKGLYPPTRGCIALARRDLLFILRHWPRNGRVRIHSPVHSPAAGLSAAKGANKERPIRT